MENINGNKQFKLVGWRKHVFGETHPTVRCSKLGAFQQFFVPLLPVELEKRIKQRTENGKWKTETERWGKIQSDPHCHQTHPLFTHIHNRHNTSPSAGNSGRVVGIMLEDLAQITGWAHLWSVESPLARRRLSLML